MIDLLLTRSEVLRTRWSDDGGVICHFFLYFKQKLHCVSRMRSHVMVHENCQPYNTQSFYRTRERVARVANFARQWLLSGSLIIRGSVSPKDVQVMLRKYDRVMILPRGGGGSVKDTHDVRSEHSRHGGTWRLRTVNLFLSAVVKTANK